MATLDATEAADFILQSIQDAHGRDPFVGGLFNAYEEAVHYEIFNAALARGFDATSQEVPLGEGQRSCDLVLPLHGRRSLWLEVKMWWFLHEAYRSPYVSMSKTRGWPLVDWERLANRPKEHHRALRLLRTWDCDAGKAREGQGR